MTGNHRRLHRQWCEERGEWTMEWNDSVFTDKSCFRLQHLDYWICVWRHRSKKLLNCCVMHLHTGPAPGIRLACSPHLTPIQNVWSIFSQQLARDTPLAATPDQLWQYERAS
ncbi:transposable element Tc3 transposase [Trichonephila clavipes]|nr:transposable element Tc3 transposase [Trichonephila clavipes]